MARNRQAAGTSTVVRLASDTRISSAILNSSLIGGQVLDERSGYPLGGMTVTVEIAVLRGQRKVIGRATTDAGGRFVVRLEPDAMESLPLIGQRDTTLTLSITDATGSVWLETPDITDRAGSESLAVVVPLPDVQPTSEDWNDFAGRLTERLHTRLHEAIRHLVLSPDLGSVVGDWPRSLRHSMASALERALLDPTGVLSRVKRPPTFFEFNAKRQWTNYRRDMGALDDPAIVVALDRAEALYKSYPGIYRVDWEVDLEAMAVGDVAAAVTKFEDAYKPGDKVAVPAVKSPLVPYRDYLRALFTGASNSDPEAQAKLADLERRFHQNFKTSNGTKTTANAILAPIIKTILTAPADEYGFGVAAGSIPIQGNKTDREYLDALIALTGLSASELGKRYRLDLQRPDAVQSTRVEENIATLQGFFRDGFQSTEDPSPIYLAKLHGHAPFFLYLDEWQRRTGPFYAENLYRFTDTFRAGVYLEHMDEALASANGDVEEAWFLETLKIETHIAGGHERMRSGEYAEAIDKYNEALRSALKALNQSINVYAEKTGQSSFDVWINLEDLIEQSASELRGKTVDAEPDLIAFTSWVQWHGRFYSVPNQSGDFATWMNQDIDHRWLSLIRVCGFVLPACLGEAALAAGDYPTAVYYFSLGTRRLVGRGPSDLVAPYREFAAENYGSYTTGILYRQGPLPYTLQRSHKATVIEPGEDGNFPPPLAATDVAHRYCEQVLHEIEKRWFRLRQADAVLQWADSLYRTEASGNTQRARELYKAGLFVLQSSPDISPDWDGSSLADFAGYLNATENPALTAFKSEARKGILQIDAGLNYYGADDRLVPCLRYRTLKEAADRFAVAAKSAEGDLLAYIGKIEDAMIERMVQSNMLAKAGLQAEIASEQTGIAKFEVGLAQRQVEAIKADIERKKQELEEESGFFEQFKDVVVGMKDTITGLPAELTGFAGSGVTTSAGASGASLAGSAALSAGTGMMAGYGIFLYAGVSSLSTVQDNLGSLDDQINALENQALPLAQAQVTARQRQVSICELQQKIAQADADLARDLLRFAQLRFLNLEFWIELANLMRRTLRRYLTLGGRFAWLAERALAFEQDRALDVVRLDYVPVKFQGITGATKLLTDLAELEAIRLDGLRQALPVRRTWSLAFDFPLQFAQLKSTGRCEFHTSEAPFRLAHPGTYGHRIETVRVRSQNMQGVTPYRGLLRNTGLSNLTRADGTPHWSLRFEDALPLTEPGSDGWVSTPVLTETLGLFEGIGVETNWILELPASVNSYGLGDLADVLFTVEARAQYSADLYDEQQQNPPASVQKLVTLSAARYGAAALAALRDPNVSGTIDVEFNLAALRLPVAESNRVVTNAFVALAAPGRGSVLIQVKAASEINAVGAALDAGVALSNAGALASGQPPQPLNGLVGLPATQTFTISFDKALLGNVSLDKVKDIVLGIEYSANVQIQ